MKIITFIAVIVSFNSLVAQFNPTKFDDLYSGSNQYYGVNNFYYSTILNDLLIFNVRNDVGFDLMVTDGDPLNITVLKSNSQVCNLVTFDNKAFFGIIDETNGAELWSTDGTEVGTVKIAEIGGVYYAPSSFKIIGSTLYFLCGNPNSGTTRQLYKLESGSSNPIVLGENLFDPVTITEFEGGLIFGAATTTVDSYLKRELYKSDGSEVGTTLIKEIKSGELGSNPDNFYLFNSKIYFTADDGVLGREIWMTDGTFSGTEILKDINSGISNSTFSFQPDELNGILYFAADNGVDGSEIWKSDGTAAGTQLFKDINPTGSSNPNAFINLNGSIVFLADNGINGKELWSSDGTSMNTSLLIDMVPGSETSTYSLLRKNKLCDNQLFFDAGTSTNIEPWVTDGTAIGTFQIADLNPTGSSLDYETNYIYFDERVFFVIYEGDGREIYTMDINCLTNSVDEKLNTEISIYPNPFNEFVTINSSGKSSLNVYSLLGELIYSIDFEDTINVNTSNFKTGSYIFRLENQFQSNNIKLIKQ